MTDLIAISPTAFSDRHPSRHANPAGWPSTMIPQGFQRRIGPSTRPVAGGWHFTEKCLLLSLIEPCGGLPPAAVCHRVGVW